MTYRDETESLRAKVATLEERLAESDAQVARLRGEAPATPRKRRRFRWLPITAPPRRGS